VVLGGLIWHGGRRDELAKVAWGWIYRDDTGFVQVVPLPIRNEKLGVGGERVQMAFFHRSTRTFRSRSKNKL